MRRYYANLLGTWTDITDDGLIQGEKAWVYFEENIFKSEYLDSFIELDYKEHGYKIHTSCLQAVNG